MIADVIPLNQMKNLKLELEVIGKIEAAFGDVVLGEGDSIYCASTEWGPSPPIPELKDCSTNDWSLLSDSELELGHNTLCFVNSDGFRYYLPAFMTWAIRRHKESDSTICDHAIYSLDPRRHDFMDTFSSGQLHAVLDFLDYCSGQTETLDSVVAKKHAALIRTQMNSDAG